MENEIPFFMIAGPTACGKSELAVRVAEKCGGEIVGADAFQIYENLALLTAQPPPELRARVAHHLIGGVPLTRRFDVAQFLALARERIADIHARGKVAIVCGGTGLYVRALLRGLADLPGADAHLRMRLEAQTPEELQHRLTELDPEAARTIDLKNPRRLIRALEVCLLTGRPFSSFREEWSKTSEAARGVLVIRDRAELHERIAGRTAAMFQAGVEDEVRALAQAGPTAAQAIGFREIQELIAGRIDREACLQAIVEATRQYAKRQMTWFRREVGLTGIELSSSTDLDTLAADLAERARI